MVSKEQIKNILQKCDIALDGNIISKEEIMRSFVTFLEENSYKNKHNNEFILHTGSICFETIAIAYAVLTCLIEDHIDPTNTLKNLKRDNLVLYTRTLGKRALKCKYKCFIDEDGRKTSEYSEKVKFVSLVGDKNAEYKVSQEYWNLIRPYYGQNDRLDGRGVRSVFPLREKFFTQILSLGKKDIPSEIKNSIILIMERERATTIIRGLSFVSESQNYSVLDLLTCSYFSEDGEHGIGNNVAKSEPNIKIVGKASVARKEITKRDSNRHIGLIISGNDIIERNEFELPELLGRRSIPNVFLLSNIDSEKAIQFIQQIENPEIFACSKKFLTHKSEIITIENELTKELYLQMEQIRNHQINKHLIEGFLLWEDYKMFKKNLFVIKNYMFESEHKDSFILHSFTLMKLLLTAVFNMELYEECVKKQLINVCSIEERFDILNQSIQFFPDELLEKAKDVITVLELLYESFHRESKKGDKILEFIKKNHDRKIAIIVPNAYYITLLKEAGFEKAVDTADLLTIINANKFNNKEKYDYIVAIGFFSGKRFGIFNCMSSKNVEVFLYDFEETLFKHSYQKARKREQEINKINTDISLLPEVCQSDNEDELEKEINEVEKNEAEIDDYVNQIKEKNFFKSIASGKNENQQSEVIAGGIFEDGERIFFSKYYRPYVLDKENNSVKEVDVSDLSEGDLIVFTKNDAQTHDIVDAVLKLFIKERKIEAKIETAYKYSNLWKEKFRSYKEENNISSKEIAAQMAKEKGIKVQEATIRRWLDPYAHIVGPRDKVSLQYIATWINDADLFDNVDKYFESIQLIRKTRLEILNEIGHAIIDKLNGLPKPQNQMMDAFFDRIDSLTQILRLDQLVNINRLMPINLINRPINMG